LHAKRAEEETGRPSKRDTAILKTAGLITVPDPSEVEGTAVTHALVCGRRRRRRRKASRWFESPTRPLNVFSSKA
jgi:hypothetical protein